MARVVITGANRGIGLELARQLSGRGDEVIALCRKAGPELRELGIRIIERVDVTDEDALEMVSRELGDAEIDILINNAGIMLNEPFHDLDFDGIRRQIEVNTLGPLLVTSILHEHLHSGSKVILMTSRMGSIGDNGSGGYYGYRMSKAALNMAGVNLAHDFRSERIAVALLHPGMVATRMTGHHGIPVEEAVAGLISRIDDLKLETSGGFWHANGERLPW
ncbi:MAG: short-chain dehydrogenase [Myxococcales bacterium SG8_38]|nr:MAG: short-chain dehydrogenase [Myxococcales bacterium SG8_38]